MKKLNYKDIAITYILLTSIFTGIEIFAVSSPLAIRILFLTATILNIVYAVYIFRH